MKTLKLKLAVVRTTAERQLVFRDKKRLATDYDRLGERVECNFPLLDPNSDQEKRIKDNITYRLDGFVSGYKSVNTGTFSDNKRTWTLYQICEEYPIVMPFIPTQNQI